MKRLVLILAVVLSASLLFAQQNTFYAYQLKGNTVGDKVTAAQALCALTPNIPCTIVIEPILASFASGSMPTKCDKCTWIDQRTSSGNYAGGASGLPEAFDVQSSTNPRAGKFSRVQIGDGTLIDENKTCLPKLGVLNPLCFSGADIGAQINAAVAALPKYTTGNGPSPSGVISLPRNAYSYATPIVINSPLVTLDGNGSNVTYTGNGIGILINDAPTSYSGWGSLQNLVLFGTSSGAVGVKLVESTWQRLWNVRISGFTSGIGLLMRNETMWTEQTDLYHVNLDNNAVGIQLENAEGNAIGGFSYARWRNVAISVYAGDVGIKGRSNAFVNGNAELSFFLADDSTAFQLEDTFDAGNNGSMSWKIRGELTGGATHANGVVAPAGTKWQGNDDRWWNSSGITDSFASGTRVNYVNCNYTTGDCLSLDNGKLSIYNGGPAGSKITFDASAVWTNRNISIPDASGAMALAANLYGAYSAFNPAFADYVHSVTNEPAITVVRISAKSTSQIAGCTTTQPAVYVENAGNGSTSDLATFANGQYSADSGPITFSLAARAGLNFRVRAGVGCTGTPANVNVTVQYQVSQ
jgi:hypothetical protein